MTLLLKEINNIAKAYDRIISRSGAEAVRFFKRRFDEQNWVDDSTQAWKPRKQERQRKGRKLRGSGKTLIQTGTLRRSIRVVSKSDTRIIIGTDVPYARIHNEGGMAGRGLKTRIPKRQFMGKSAYLERQIARIMHAEIRNAIKK